MSAVKVSLTGDRSAYWPYRSINKPPTICEGGFCSMDPFSKTCYVRWSEPASSSKIMEQVSPSSNQEGEQGIENYAEIGYAATKHPSQIAQTAWICKPSEKDAETLFS